jgi:signal transduction histidine kinase
LKDEFVGTISHELRTPLTSISGSLGLLVGQWASKLPEAAARLLAIAHANSQRLVRLINDIRDIEKLGSAMPQPRWKTRSSAKWLRPVLATPSTAHSIV